MLLFLPSFLPSFLPPPPTTTTTTTSGSEALEKSRQLSRQATAIQNVLSLGNVDAKEAKEMEVRRRRRRNGDDDDDKS